MQGVTEGMARGGLGNPCAPDRVLDGSLKNRLVEVVAASLTGHAVHIEASRWEDPLPSPGSASVRVLAQERAGQFDPASDGLADTVEEAGLRRLGRAGLPTGPQGATITAGRQRHVVA